MRILAMFWGPEAVQKSSKTITREYSKESSNNSFLISKFVIPYMIYQALKKLSFERFSRDLHISSADDHEINIFYSL